MDAIDIPSLRAETDRLTENLPDGSPLDAQAAALIGLAAAVSVTSLDRAAIDEAIGRALDTGASMVQLQEIIALASGLGVHSLMASSAVLLAEGVKRGLVARDVPRDVERQRLWDKHVGDDPFWTEFSSELPGFLEALLQLSPEVFTGFFEYCAIPWRSGTVRAWIKELAALACDASPSHRFRPGFRVHLKNAIKLGVGRTAIYQTLDIAAAAPEHRGFA
ncbi:carboxymuconolactone decarboxylase family protein [Aquisediminimonas profunda]|uniref:carboxymuconolactone decarboxylase family protein n=1 Tax=Aquisediminimonas profunda TaxID=1550733 RepID=UPI001FE881D2|nr:carboxymuconolactone decarboxylase family protein [Aquisediminimonas profunda]